MKIDILTLFPEMFKGPFDESIIKRAKEKGLVEINIYNLRDWATDKHKSVDDRPYGGGVGMVLRVDVIDKALEKLKSKIINQNPKIILLSAKGKRFTQSKAKQLSKINHLILVCGHYEDVDQRVTDYLIDEEISIGDYVLTGGELPTMVVVDSIVRLIPGALGAQKSTVEESHSKKGYIEYPHYTRPETYKGWKVPEVLLSGNHKEIEDWKKSSHNTGK